MEEPFLKTDKIVISNTFEMRITQHITECCTVPFVSWRPLYPIFLQIQQILVIHRLIITNVVAGELLSIWQAIKLPEGSIVGANEAGEIVG